MVGERTWRACCLTWLEVQPTRPIRRHRIAGQINGSTNNVPKECVVHVVVVVVVVVAVVAAVLAKVIVYGDKSDGQE